MRELRMGVLSFPFYGGSVLPHTMREKGMSL